MARRKARALPALPEQPETPVMPEKHVAPETAAVEERVPASPEREPIASPWREWTRYACPFCAFDALEDDAKVREHIAAHHPEPTPHPLGGNEEWRDRT